MRTLGFSRVLFASLFLALAMPRTASAACTPGGLRATGVTVGYRWQGVNPVTEIVFLSGDSDLSTLGYSQKAPIDLLWIADQSGSNCKTDAHIHLSGVGLSRESGATATCSSDAQCGAGTTRQCQHGGRCNYAPAAGQFTFGDVWANALPGSEILAASPLGSHGDLDYFVYLGVTTSSLATVPSYPQVGTLDFVESGPLNGIDGGGGGANCVFNPDPRIGTCLVLTSVSVYVENVGVMASLPVLFGP